MTAQPKRESSPSSRQGDKVWTDRAGSYGWNVDATLSSRLKALLARRYLAADGRLCDVGCANGLFIRVLAPHCAHVTGLDLNAAMLEQARTMVADEQFANVGLVRGDGMRLPLRDAAYDMVCCFSTLLLIPDVDAALREMARILKPGGVMILDVAGRYNLSALYWNLWYRRRGHFGIRAFSHAAIVEALDRIGCSTLEAHALGFCDQWKYVPGPHMLKHLDRFFHRSPDPDINLDYRISNLPGLFRFANRWYIVARKDARG